jgi:hypothetical protein
MPEHTSRASRYRDRAAECHRLAGSTSDTQLRAHYTEMAEQYLALAEAEELVPTKPPP